jgi:hypothetical protein
MTNLRGGEERQKGERKRRWRGAASLRGRHLISRQRLVRVGGMRVAEMEMNVQRGRWPVTLVEIFFCHRVDR